jgi:membrane protease YdiL (CAAX protease family)
MPSRRHVALFIELLTLFIVLPVGYWLWPAQIGIARPFPLLVLWIFALGCLVALLRDTSFDRRQLWNAAAVWPHLPMIGLHVLIGGALLVGLLLFFIPDRFLYFPRNNPVFWGIVMVAYPLVSVYPQNLIYRVFLLHRYRELLIAPALAIGVSAVTFSVVHMGFFAPAIAMSFTLVGGVLFAHTYIKTRSALAASIEHALFGCLIFTIGWGYYFYHGAADN